MSKVIQDAGRPRKGRSRVDWGKKGARRVGFLGRILLAERSGPAHRKLVRAASDCEDSRVVLYAGPGADGIGWSHRIPPDDFPADSFFPMGFRYTPWPPTRGSGPHRVAPCSKEKRFIDFWVNLRIVTQPSIKFSEDNCELINLEEAGCIKINMSNLGHKWKY